MHAVLLIDQIVPCPVCVRRIALVSIVTALLVPRTYVYRQSCAMMECLAGITCIPDKLEFHESQSLAHLDSIHYLVLIVFERYELPYCLSALGDEGFGIPLIESMSRATPVVCSDIEIFREVGASGATFFEPDRADSFAAAVLKLSGEWKAKSDLALQNSARFDWKTSAAALNDYLKQFD